MRTVYKFANSVSIPAAGLLQLLFVNLEEDSLAFLGGIWNNSTELDIRVASLRHAAAFLEAHRSTEQCIDFQTILPSLIIALQTLDSQGKEAALECISQLVVSREQRFCAVYGLNSIYGDGSGARLSYSETRGVTVNILLAKLQFLDRDDYKRYVGALVEHKEHLAADSDYLTVFHREHLGKAKSDKKKDGEYVVHLLLQYSS